MAAFFSTMVARLAVSPIVPQLIDAFSASKGTIGLALTGMWAAYAVTQLPAGLLADRYGERTLVLVALSITTVGGIALVLSPSYLAFAGAVIVIGIGAGVYFPPAASLITRRFDNTGAALGIHISGGDAGGLVAPVIVSAVAVQYDWRTALVVAPATAVPVLVLCGLRLRTGPRVAPTSTLRERADPAVLFGLLARRRVAYTTALATLLMFVFQAVISFFPTFLVEYWGAGTGLAGNLLAAVFLLWIAFMPVTGRLSDAVGHDGILVATTLGMIAGVVLLLVAPTFPVALVGVVFLGVGMSWGGVLASRFMAHLPEADRTTGYGLVRSLYVLLGSTGSVVTGTLAGAAGWQAAYGLLVVVLGVVGLSLVANRTLGLGL